MSATKLKKNRRRYKVDYNLRKKGNTIVTRKRFVTKRAKVVTEIEKKWLLELVDLGYCVGDGLFTD